MDPAGLSALSELIQRLHGCVALHEESVPVIDVQGGRIVWDGEVQLFNLIGHPDARECYAWSEGDQALHAVLRLPRNLTAVDAIRLTRAPQALEATPAPRAPTHIVVENGAVVCLKCGRRFKLSEHEIDREAERRAFAALHVHASMDRSRA